MIFKNPGPAISIFSHIERVFLSRAASISCATERGFFFRILARRKALYAEFQKIVVDECPLVFLSNLATYVVADKQVSGLPRSIWNFMTPLTALSAV